MSHPLQTASHAPVAPRRQIGRLVVPDVLRGIAIVAMLIAHADGALLRGMPAPIDLAMDELNDLASPLFAFVMGISAQLVWDRTVPGRRGVVVVQQIARGVILIVLGVWLAAWGGWVDVVLAYLGVLLIVAAPLLVLSSVWIVGIAAALVLLAEPLVQTAQLLLGPAVADLSVPIAADAARWVALGANYRLLSLLPMFLLGVLAARRGMPAGAALGPIAGVGLMLAAVEPIASATLPGGWPSGGWIDTAHDLALVLLVYAGVAGLAGVRSPALLRVLRVLAVPLRACGSVALSLYVLQIALIAWWWSMGIGYQRTEWGLWLVLVPGLVLIGLGWWRVVGLGPIEWLLGAVTGRFRLIGRPQSGER